ncbi:MAG: zinc-dependent metalloprotease family protein [Bacteroidota bacterium]|nr:zinc-dependent metalloprotease family protein [Bacteroidota bacterium]
MRKLYKFLLTFYVVGSIPFIASAQQDKYWSATDAGSVAVKHKAAARQAFPKDFRVFNLHADALKQQLFQIVDKPGISTRISLPNAAGTIEVFEIFEASNFVPELQARFPQIRAFSGRGITDKGATLKLSYAPNWVQTMVFRANGEANEYIEPYSQDGKAVAVFKSQRSKGGLPWVCSTPDANLAQSLNNRVYTNGIESNTGQLKTMRLAQSCNGEYSNFFGAFNASQVALVLAGYNATLTRCNGCYERDLAIHLNLIANTDLVIFYDPATDPYTTMGLWNNQLQATLTSIIGEANYDIGHMFGASGGGGNAGCIGCVCVDNQKGRGITSPADAIPQGDNFDIDYVAHEVGHQMGGNHTFSMSNEGVGVNKEVGSGITIMGYAGITNQDVAPHSIDIFHEASIQQIQVNMATKSCPITISQTGINATPVVAAVANYTIPKTTPFALTGSATDANPGDVLTYCWEQDQDGAGQTGNNSVARENKPTGPNWLTWPATTNPTRLFPRLSTILTGASVTGPLPGGDAIANTEALSSVARPLNYRLTVRDNRPYNGTAVGQTQFIDMVVTVDDVTGPFLITTQNSAVSYFQGDNQTISWSVNGTTGAPINCANVKISFSTDNGAIFTTLIASTPNDGSEVITIPGVTTTQGRFKVEAIGNIFFDINNAQITVAPPPNGFSFNSPAPVTAACPAPNLMTSTNLTATYLGSFAGNINLTGAVIPNLATVSFSNPALTTGSPSTTVSLTGMATLNPGNYTVTVTGVGVGGPTITRDIVFTINPGSGPVITTQPTNQAACTGANAIFNSAATGATFQWQVSTPAIPAFTNIPVAISPSYTVTGATIGQNGNQYRVIATGQCGSTTSNVATLTVNVGPAVTTNPTSQSVCSGSAVSFVAAASGTPAPGYQWQVSTIAVPAFTNILGATSPTYTIPSTTVAMNGDQYRAVITNTCGSVNTTTATLLVSSSVTISANPTNQTVCEATNTSFTVSAAGSGLTYQWQLSTDGGGSYNNVPAAAPYSGSTTPTLTITNVPPSLNGYRYRAIVSSGVCTPGTSSAAILTVNTFPVITAQPVAVTICEGASASVSVTATTGVGVLTYQWQFSTDAGATWNNIAGATANTFAQPLVSVGQNGYRFRVIVTAGCGSVTSNAVAFTVNTFPVISFSPVTVVCVSDPAFTLSATPVGGVFSGSGISGTTFNPSIAGVGPKAITYTISNAGCQSVQTRTILVNECAERHLRLQDFPATIIYPNPNIGDFNIRLNTDLYTTIDVKLFNSLGKLVKQQVATGLSYGSVIAVNTNNLPNGIYHLYLTNGSDKKSQSILIQKF